MRAAVVQKQIARPGPEMSGEGFVYGLPAARFLPFSGVSTAESVEVFEFDEADLWSAVEAAAARRWPSARAPKKAAEAARRAPASMPVNIPDWTGISRGRRDSDEEEEESEGDGDGEEEARKWMPPHEYLARQVERRRRRNGVVSCSVEEGSGRGLKGRELWRVRDAIWEKIGFQD